MDPVYTFYSAVRPCEYKHQVLHHEASVRSRSEKASIGGLHMMAHRQVIKTVQALVFTNNFITHSNLVVKNNFEKCDVEWDYFCCFVGSNRY